MFCEKSLSADKELKLIASSTSSHPSYTSNIRDLKTSTKESMSSFMLAGWKTRIDPGD
jgi:hypothetical protein